MLYNLNIPYQKCCEPPPNISPVRQTQHDFPGSPPTLHDFVMESLFSVMHLSRTLNSSTTDITERPMSGLVSNCMASDQTDN